LVSAQSPRAAEPHALVTLPDSVPGVARYGRDQGAVPDSFPAARILLMLRRSPKQQSALDQFLRDVHTPGSPAYHHWLTTAEFAAQYGADDAGIAAVQEWLQQQGFSVGRVTAGKTAIEFSGTAGQLRSAFHTEIHTYTAGTLTLHANNAPLQIPAAFSQFVAGLTPLYDLRPQPNSVVLGKAKYDSKTGKAAPLWTWGQSYQDKLPWFVLAPGDFALQYNLNPLYRVGVKGSGVTIGVIGASNIDPVAVTNYQSMFGLPNKPVKVIVDGNDPLLNLAWVESALDVEWSGAVAPGATIDLYTAEDTALQSGLALAALRAVDEDAADILSVSYGECEQALGEAGNEFWNALWEQAAAQGQTVLVSSGDGGAAGCEIYASPPARDGAAANGIGSTPWNLSVGGTDFYYSSYNRPSDQMAELETYWDTNTTQTPAVSLLKPVPEQVWNPVFGMNLLESGQPNTNEIVAGGGSPSTCVKGTAASDGSISACSGGYAKPLWQTGAGVPADGARDLPDVSLFAGGGDNQSFYPVCAAIADCADPNSELYFFGVGGTSASAQVMAGMLALVEQKYGRQGQAGNVLYALAAQHPEVFHDIASGNNMVPCRQGSPDCSLSTANDLTNGTYVLGYDAGPGYDLATGLGAVDANLLVSDWNALSFTATNTNLALSETTFAHGTPVTAQVSVTGNGGTPTGDVALVTTASPARNTGLGTMTLSGGTASGTFSNLPGGTYEVKARYGGDGKFAASASAPITVTVAPEPSATSLGGQTWAWGQNHWSPLANGGSYVYGAAVVMDAQPKGGHAPDGVPTGKVTFTDGSNAPVILGVNSQGTAEWLPGYGFAPGQHSVAASYSGDGSYGASQAPPFNFTVKKATPLPGGDVSCGVQEAVVGTPVCLISGIHVAFLAGKLPTGTITWFLGNKRLGSASILCCDSQPPGGSPYVYLSANITAKDLPLGVNTITAEYSGDDNYNPIQADKIQIKIVLGVKLNLSYAVTATQSTRPDLTVTAHVAGVSGYPAPTGSARFWVIGPDGYYIDDETAPLRDGTASYTFPSTELPYGKVSAGAAYSGDDTYAYTYDEKFISLLQPFTVSGTAVNLQRGQSGTSTITIAPAPNLGFKGTVALKCNLLLPSVPAGTPVPTCGIASSARIQFDGPVTTPMTISAAGNAVAARNSGRWFYAGGSTALAILFLFGIPGRRRSWQSLTALLLAAALLAGISACAGSPTIASGAYTFRVTATSTTANVINQQAIDVVATIQ